VLRRLVRIGEIDHLTAEFAISSLLELDLERHAHDLLLQRIWSLRSNLTAYDATYVALAESLGARLLTCDARLANAPGVRRIALVLDP
jgi:predicted nucleic acid-binding protein